MVDGSQSLAPSYFFFIGGNAQIKLDVTDVVLLLAEKWMMSMRSAREKNVFWASKSDFW